MKINNTTVVIALLFLTLCAVVVDTAITLRLQAAGAGEPTLPCAAIPRRLVTDHPDCAKALLESMNVTNVRVQRQRRDPSDP